MGSLLSDLRARSRLESWRKGETVFSEGQSADAVYLLESGLIKTVKSSPTAENAAMGIIAPGRLFGMMAVLDGKPYPVTAVPICDSSAYRVPAAQFSSMLRECPDFSREVHVEVGVHFRQTQMMLALASAPVPCRVARALLMLAESMGNELAVRRADIAELAGCTAETATRTLGAWRKKGLISSGWKRITILQPANLARLAASL